MTAKVGRPSNSDKDIRENLLVEARRLFAEYGYDKVTTRMVAEAAGANPAMIRYYFIDKAGLFETMLKETLSPLLQMAKEQARKSGKNDISDFIYVYYKVMAPYPTLPSIIFRALHNQHSAEFKVVSKVFPAFVQQMLFNLSLALKAEGALKKDILPFEAFFTCVSLSVFPFLLPPLVKEALGLEVNEEFLAKMANHYNRLLTDGMVNTKL